MAFFDPEVSKPYSSLMYDYPEESARLDADAARRAREFGAQSAAARGSRSARGPALNTYNRIMSDYTLGKAATDRADKLAWSQGQARIMGQPGAVTPSTLSTLGAMGGHVGGAILKEAAPDIWKKLKWWDSSPKELTQQYTSMGSPSVSLPPSGGGGGGVGDFAGSLTPTEYLPYSTVTNGYGGGEGVDYSPYVSQGVDYSPYVSSASDLASSYGSLMGGGGGYDVVNSLAGPADYVSQVPEGSDWLSSIISSLF